VPRTEGTNERGKRIPGNTPKVGPAKGGGLWKRWAGVVKGEERERLVAGWAKKAEWLAGLIRKK
jgi:hypothetical protein